MSKQTNSKINSYQALVLSQVSRGLILASHYSLKAELWEPAVAFLLCFQCLYWSNLCCTNSHGVAIVERRRRKGKLDKWALAVAVLLAVVVVVVEAVVLVETELLVTALVDGVVGVVVEVVVQNVLRSSKLTSVTE